MVFCSMSSRYNLDEEKKLTSGQDHFLCGVGTFSPRLRGFSLGTLFLPTSQRCACEVDRCVFSVPV